MAKNANQALDAALDNRPPAPVRAINTEPKAVSTAQVVPAIRIKKALQEARIQLTGYLHNVWDVTAERTVTIDDVMDPDFWKHVAVKFKPYDTINVLAEDGSWYARLLIISADRLWAKVYKMEFHDLTAAGDNMPQTQEDEYEVNWTTFGKFAIHKKSNRGQQPLKDGFQTKVEAYVWLDGHLKTLNG